MTDRPVPDPDRVTGTVCKLHADKGYGFIAVGETRYFFHRHSLTPGEFDQLQVGDAVLFVPDEGPKGLRTDEMRRL